MKYVVDYRVIVSNRTFVEAKNDKEAEKTLKERGLNELVKNGKVIILAKANTHVKI